MLFQVTPLFIRAWSMIVFIHERGIHDFHQTVAQVTTGDPSNAILTALFKMQKHSQSPSLLRVLIGISIDWGLVENFERDILPQLKSQCTPRLRGDPLAAAPRQ